MRLRPAVAGSREGSRKGLPEQSGGTARVGGETSEPAHGGMQGEKAWGQRWTKHAEGGAGWLEASLIAGKSET